MNCFREIFGFGNNSKCLENLKILRFARYNEFSMHPGPDLGDGAMEGA